MSVWHRIEHPFPAQSRSIHIDRYSVKTFDCFAKRLSCAELNTYNLSRSAFNGHVDFMLLQNIKSRFGKLYIGLSVLLKEEKKFEESESHKVNRTFNRPKMGV